MLVKLLGVSLAALAVAEKTHNVTVECVDDNDITISVAYDRPNVKVLNFLAGSCNTTGDIEWSQNNKTNAVDIKMSMRDCGLRSNDRSRVTRDLRTIFFDNIATFTLGRRDDNRDMVFYENKVNVTCAVKDTYTVAVGYGPINADFTKADGLDGGEKRYSFAMRSVDADFNATVVPSSRAGDTVHLLIDSSDVDFQLYKYAVTSCVFEETNNKTVVTSYKLFDSNARSCKNEFLDFTIAYCNATNAFKISHTVFTFDPTNENNYTLTCHIKLCDFDVTKSVEVCNKMEQNCNIPEIKPVVPAPPANATSTTKKSSHYNSATGGTFKDFLKTQSVTGIWDRKSIETWMDEAMATELLGYYTNGDDEDPRKYTFAGIALLHILFKPTWNKWRWSLTDSWITVQTEAMVKQEKSEIKWLFKPILTMLDVNNAVTWDSIII